MAQNPGNNPNINQNQQQLQDIIDQFDTLSGLSESIQTSILSTLQDLKDVNIAVSIVNKTLKDQAGIQEKIKFFMQDAGNLNKKDIELLKEKHKQSKASLDVAKTLNDNRIKEIEHLKTKTALGTKEWEKLEKKNQQAIQYNELLKYRGITEEKAFNESIERASKYRSLIDDAKSYGDSTFGIVSKMMNQFGLDKLADNLGLDAFEERTDAMSKKLIKDRATAAAGLSGVDEKDLTSDHKEEIAKRIKDVTITSADKLMVMAGGLKSMVKDLAGALPEIVLLTLLASIVTSLKETDKRIGDTAKNLNISYGYSLQLDKQFTDMSINSGNIFINTKGISETFNYINSQLGTNAVLNSEYLKTFTEIREKSGMTNEELKGIGDLTLSNNGNLAKTTDEFTKQSEAVSKQFGISLNSKKLMADISNVSAATTLSLGKNPKLIAEAVTVTKALGMEMGKIESIMDNMLDFESSIENELSAELLTGRNINLEAARWASLNNDVAGAAREINSQIGGSAEFSKMNRIQQEGLAKAVGMNREELAKTLFVQDQLKNISGQDAENKKRLFQQRVDEIGLEKAKQEMQEGGLNGLLKQASVQDELRKSIESMKEPLVQIAQTLTPIFQMFGDIVGFIGKSKFAMGGLIGLLTTMAGIMAVLKALAIAKAIADMFSLSAMTFGVGAIAALAVGGIATGAILSATTQKTNDGIAPSSRGPFTVTDRYGATAVTAEGDHMVVSPNVSRSSYREKQHIQQNTTTVDMSETNSLLKSLLRKQGNVQIDSTKMGTAIGMNTYRIQ